MELAEGEGFEPSVQVTLDNRFQGGRTRPLCEPSPSRPSSGRAYWLLAMWASLEHLLTPDGKPAKHDQRRTRRTDDSGFAVVKTAIGHKASPPDEPNSSHRQANGRPAALHPHPGYCAFPPNCSGR